MNIQDCVELENIELQEVKFKSLVQKLTEADFDFYDTFTTKQAGNKIVVSFSRYAGFVPSQAFSAQVSFRITWRVLEDYKDFSAKLMQHLEDDDKEFLAEPALMDASFMLSFLTKSAGDVPLITPPALCLPENN